MIRSRHPFINRSVPRGRPARIAKGEAVVYPQEREEKMSEGWTEGKWEYVASNEHHGPYVIGPWGGDICDCYVMSNPMSASVRNGGDSKPIHFQPGEADANARLIAAAPALYEALKRVVAVADRRTDEFDAARDALDLARGVRK